MQRVAHLGVLRVSRFMRAAALLVTAMIVGCVGAPQFARAQAAAAPEYFHLRQGVTFYIVNPDGKAFDVALDLKDINTYCRGPQTTLLKAYDPDGDILHDEFVPDDGVESGGYDQAWAGWDHEMWALGAKRENGDEPLFKWDAFSDPRKLELLKGQQRTLSVKAGKKGVYQIMLAGCDDHFVKLAVSGGLKFGVAGHPDFFAGRGDQLRTAYLYIPQPTYYTAPRKAVDVWVIEHGFPRTRKVSFSIDGAPIELTDTQAKAPAAFASAGQGLGRYEIPMAALKPGSVIKMTNQGAGDFMLRVHNIPPIFCPDEATARAIGGGLITCSDSNVVAFPWQKQVWDTLKDLKKEDFLVDTQGGKWNQIAAEDLRSIQWGLWGSTFTPGSVDAILKSVNDAVEKTQPFTPAALLRNFPSFWANDLIVFYLYPFKGNGLYRNPALRNVIAMQLAREWMKFRYGEVIYEPVPLNVAYAQGFHWDNWEPVWNMKDDLDPRMLKALQRGVTDIAQRMSCANGLELVISNGRTTVPLNIYHAYLISGDERIRKLALAHLDRMVNATDGWQSAGSKSGFFKEHFAADGGYCTYPLYQLGRLYNISREPAALDAVERLSKWICYTTMPNGYRHIGPTSWNARISASGIEHMWGYGFKYIATKGEYGARLYAIFYGTPDKNPANYNVPDPAFEPGKPLPKTNTMLLAPLSRGVLPAKPLPADSPEPFFENLGDANEFFFVRRGKYYAIAYAGRRTAHWMDATFGGPNSFTGGGIAGLYVHGVGTCVLGRVNREYGWPPEQWNEMAIPVVAGDYSNGKSFNTGVSRCTPAANKAAWSLTTSGEAVDAPVNFDRSYQFNEASIAATVTLADANLNKDVFIYREYFRKDAYLFVKQAWEIVPFLMNQGTTLTAYNAAGAAIGEITEQPIADVAMIEMSNGKGGVRLKLDQPRAVKLSASPAKERAAGHGLDTSARAVQIKLADKLERGASATLKYEIIPWTK